MRGSAQPPQAKATREPQRKPMRCFKRRRTGPLSTIARSKGTPTTLLPSAFRRVHLPTVRLERATCSISKMRRNRPTASAKAVSSAPSSPPACARRWRILLAGRAAQPRKKCKICSISSNQRLVQRARTPVVAKVVNSVVRLSLPRRPALVPSLPRRSLHEAKIDRPTHRPTTECRPLRTASARSKRADAPPQPPLQRRTRWPRATTSLLARLTSPWTCTTVRSSTTLR